MLSSLSNRLNTFLLVLLVLMAGAIIAILANRAGAGPLDPPRPPGPTQQTQINSLPFNITQSGGYILTRNLTGVSGQNGITIDAPNVVIDLKGFTLAGVSGALSGIAETGTNSHAGLVVTNGDVDNWPSGAIATPGVSEGRFEYLHVTGNGQVPGTLDGTLRAGNDSVVDHVTLIGNGGAGIQLDHGARISDCLLDNFQPSGPQLGEGIAVIDQASVRDCTIVGFAVGLQAANDAEVLESTVRWSSVGIEISDGGTVHNCVVDLTGAGIDVGLATTVTDNVITTTGGDAIHVNFINNKIDGNTITSANTGVYLPNNDNTVTRNHFRAVTNPIVNAGPPGNDFPPQGPASSLSSPWGNVID